MADTSDQRSQKKYYSRLILFLYFGGCVYYALEALHLYQRSLPVESLRSLISRRHIALDKGTSSLNAVYCSRQPLHLHIVHTDNQAFTLPLDSPYTITKTKVAKPVTEVVRSSHRLFSTSSEGIIVITTYIPSLSRSRVNWYEGSRILMEFSNATTAGADVLTWVKQAVRTGDDACFLMAKNEIESFLSVWTSGSASPATHILLHLAEAAVKSFERALIESNTSIEAYEAACALRRELTVTKHFPAEHTTALLLPLLLPIALPLIHLLKRKG